MAPAHDGSDYQHRQKILPQYQTMALSKKRLKFTIILHMLIALLMLFKLLPTILDLLNIFWQPIEELYIPLAKPWEWVWLAGLLVAIPALGAIRTNNSLRIKFFLLGIFSCCLVPLVYCAYIYSADFRTYVITRDAEKTSEIWSNRPVALYWYIFIGVACQVHVFELYFAWELLRSMNNRRTPVNKRK